MTLRSATLMTTALLGAGLLLSACGGSRPESQSEYTDPLNQTGIQGNLFGASNAGIGATKSGGGSTPQSATAVGVNAYLWRGALDTLSFMPLASADPFGGVIITDWYQPPSTPGERFKATAYILGRELRADGIRIAVFRQTLQGGQWVDADLAPNTATDIENKVLARARELRARTAG
jgi:hypothetical protein